MSFSDCREFSLLGLALIAVGTGGIKPCVSAFGGDQFKLPEQERQLQTFFSVFYFAINAGSLISTALTPILRYLETIFMVYCNIHKKISGHCIPKLKLLFQRGCSMLWRRHLLFSCLWGPSHTYVSSHSILCNR